LFKQMCAKFLIELLGEIIQFAKKFNNFKFINDHGMSVV
jgi:hypothetical protein